MNLCEKTAIVTGGGTGQGRAISLKLADEGANLAIVYSRSVNEAEKTSAECARRGVRAMPLKADVAIDSDVKSVVARVSEQFGRIDVLINNAGTTIFKPMSDIESIDEEDWDRIMAVNTKAHWLLARAVVPHMRLQGGGVIVSIASIAGLAPRGSSLPYCVSKAGALLLAKCLAAGLAPEIRVNTVSPGLLMTRWWGETPVELVQQYLDSAPLKRATTVDDVADAVLMVVKNDSMTGQNVVVDSGLAM